MMGKYPVLESQSSFILKPAGLVTDVVMGYKVGMDISMSASLKKEIQELTSKSLASGGSVSLMGWSWGAGASGSGGSSSSTSVEKIFSQSGSSSVSLPGMDTGYPVLMGVKCAKLPEVKASKAPA
jgi:hypothetical protein